MILAVSDQPHHRCNCHQTIVAYTASSAALAALEVLVYVDRLTAPVDLRLLGFKATRYRDA